MKTKTQNHGLNLNTFNPGHLFNNSKGKTDLALLMAAVMILAAVAGFLWSIYKTYDAGVTGAIVFSTVGGSLLGVRRFTQDKTIQLTPAETTPAPVADVQIIE